MSRTKRLTDTERMKIVRKAAEGVSTSELAANFGGGHAAGDPVHAQERPGVAAGCCGSSYACPRNGPRVGHSHEYGACHEQGRSRPPPGSWLQRNQWRDV